MRVPLVVATVAAWFTLAFVFQSSLQVYSRLKQHKWVRRLLLDERLQLTEVRPGAH
jgi:hypothetical protein